MVSPPVGPEEVDVSLREYLNVFARRGWILAASLVLCLGLAAGLTVGMPSVYQAATTVTIDKTPPVILLDRSGEVSLFADQAAAQAPDVFTLAELIKSETVRDGAIGRLERLIGVEAAKQALKGLTVQQVRGTELVRVTVEHTNPTAAAAAANALAESLIQINLKSRRERATETREFIQRELDAARARLRESEDALVVFRNLHAEISLPQETTLNLQKLADLQAQLVDLGLQRRTAQSRIAAARDRLTSQAKISPTQWTPSPLIAGLQEQLARLEIELAGLRREFTARHPAILSTQAKIQETQQRLNTELAKNLNPGVFGVDPVYQQLVQDLAQTEITQASLDSRERALKAAIAVYADRVREVPTRESELTRLTRNVKEVEQIALLLSQKSQDARVAETSIGSAVRVVDVAKVPDVPVKPRRFRNMALGAVFGLMMGVAIAFVAEQLDDTVKSVEDVERVLGAPVLGAIPFVKAPRVGPLPLFLTNGARQSPAAEAFRVLRTHILLSKPGVEHRLLLVTSALPGEGKSTVAANLAVAMARTDRRVWLIETDFRHPALGRWFPEAESPGLASVLRDGARVEDVVRASSEPNLWYISSGGQIPNPAESLEPKHLAGLVETARAKADVILFDGPPLLSVADAEVTAAQADGVLVVVKVGQTRREALARARQRLDRVGTNVVGAVLNFVPGGHPNGY